MLELSLPPIALLKRPIMELLPLLLEFSAGTKRTEDL
jgi:hypothetical protein